MADDMEKAFEADEATEAAMIVALESAGCPIVTGLSPEQYEYLREWECIGAPPVPMLTRRGMTVARKLRAMPPRKSESTPQEKQD